ncbi:MAG TPA: prepilin-type N-terminal cleavage/methylation domain-containing protein [Thermoanaerobaculia bacterium]|nr:prepilin-type N-terminal cleavage/methylation domain-containing protein [Thermoanaerobaculia bacterium]
MLSFPRVFNIMAIPSGPSKPGQGGFTLLEALIALVLLGVALLIGLELVLQNPRMVRRMDGERQAFRAMESTIESVRGGAIPLETADLGVFSTAVGTPAPRDLDIFMQVDPTPLPGLFQVTLQARYTADKHKVQKELQTMVWSPP